MSAVNNLVVRGRNQARTERGEGVIPSGWRGFCARADEAGVYVVVPRLTGEEWSGPVQWLAGAQPVVGDQVLVMAVEGRKDDLVVVGVLTR